MILTNENFFDVTAQFYDSMINFNEALKRKTAYLRSLIKPHMKTAADLGCGTGADSIALAMNGLTVTGFDISQNMITEAKKNADRYEVNIRFYKHPLDKIPEQYYNKFCFVTSLGNTFANLSYDELKNTINNIYLLLNESGEVLIQLLNYSKIIKENERIIGINQTEDYFTTRFYDFHEQELNFNILRVQISNPTNRKLLTTKMYPHTAKQLRELFETKGFKEIKFWSDIKKTNFSIDDSKDVFLWARK